MTIVGQRSYWRSTRLMCRLWQWNGVVLRSPSAAIVVGCHWYASSFVHQLCTLLSSQSVFGRSQVIGKADTIHSAQGVTVGRGQALKHVLLKWSRSRRQIPWPVLYWGELRKGYHCHGSSWPTVRTRCTINRSVATNCFCTIAWLPLTPLSIHNW